MPGFQSVCGCIRLPSGERADLAHYVIAVGGEWLPCSRLPRKTVELTCLPHYYHLGSGQQEAFSFNPECLHFRDWMKRCRRTQWPLWLNPRGLLRDGTVPGLQIGLPFVHPGHPKAAPKTEYVFTISTVIYQGKSFHQKMRRKPVFYLFEESHMVDSDT